MRENKGGSPRHNRGAKDFAGMHEGRVQETARYYGWSRADQSMLTIQWKNPERLSALARSIRCHELEYVTRPADRYTSACVVAGRWKATFTHKSQGCQTNTAPVDAGSGIPRQDRRDGGVRCGGHDAALRTMRSPSSLSEMQLRCFVRPAQLSDSGSKVWSLPRYGSISSARKRANIA